MSIDRENGSNKGNRLSRRELFHTTSLGMAGYLLSDSAFASSSHAAAPNPSALDGTLNRFPRMMQEYMVHRVRERDEQIVRIKSELKTREDAEAYVRLVRDKIQRCFGKFPQKTPLNPRITGVVERGSYRIEKVLFESRPEFWVTANLYVPQGLSFPRPGVVGVCGHSFNGKAAEPYQSFSQGLARMGYVVLTIDPIGQGERLQYADESLKSIIGAGVMEHLHAGNQQFLVGEFFGSWRAWDGIRALDYLLSREEVDPTQVGVTGISGGGTMSTWLCGLESRFTMAAPGCFVTTFRRNMENELPADTEQCPPRTLALHLDHDDFIAAMAPKPILLLGKERDYFDIRGLKEAYERLRHLYSLLGHEENIQLFVGPAYHGYSQDLREAMYRWFNRATQSSTLRTEPELIIESDETLWCTPHGQVCELQSRTVYSFTRETSQALSKQRIPLKGSALQANVRDILKLPETRGIPDYRILRQMAERNYPKPHFTTYMVETEPGIHVLVYSLSDEVMYSRPAKGADQTILYVSHQSSDADLREEPLLRELIEGNPKAAFFTCDVRGIGESLPNTCDRNFLEPYGCDYFYAIHSLMLDTPYVGQRTYDILRVLDWLKSHEQNQIHLVAKGWGTIPATFAALLSQDVQQVTLKNALTSYSDLAEAETYRWPLSSLLPNVLQTFDLPDCYRELQSKSLQISEPWGANYA